MLRILLAEDEILLRLVFQDFLTDLGHEVIAVVDGQEALDMLRVAPFDVLVTDIHMPRMTGVELLRVVGAEFPDLPCIVASAFARSAMQQDLARTRARILGFAEKPFTFDALERLLARVERRPAA